MMKINKIIVLCRDVKIIMRKSPQKWWGIPQFEYQNHHFNTKNLKFVEFSLKIRLIYVESRIFHHKIVV